MDLFHDDKFIGQYHEGRQTFYRHSPLDIEDLGIPGNVLDQLETLGCVTISAIHMGQVRDFDFKKFKGRSRQMDLFG